MYSLQWNPYQLNSHISAPLAAISSVIARRVMAIILVPLPSAEKLDRGAVVEQSRWLCIFR